MESVNKPLRVLCLHAYGANNRVLEAQTAALRHELGDAFEWVFVEGTVPVPMDPAFSGCFPKEDQYYYYCNLDEPETLAKALDDLHDFTIYEGPFDFIMGNCGASSVIAALLMRNADEASREDPLFKGAFFFDGLTAFDHTALHETKVKFLENAKGATLAIPTANIWSERDEEKSIISAKLATLCRPELNFNFTHKASGIPGASDEAALVGAAHVIRKTVDLALSAH